MSRDLDALIAGLTIDEKAALTAGRDNWATAAVERAGIPSVRLTDGPNGARGSSVLGAGEASAVCIPCGSALGATWDPELVERLGALLGEEALTKHCRILLAPTLNLHRSPLAGRNFECFSEDPLLAGRAAAAYVRGVQSARRRHHPQAPGRQRGRAGPLHDVVGDRRARAARALPRAVRARRPRGRRARAHDRLQPAQRRLLHRGRGAPERHPAGRVGLRRLRRLRLVRARLDERLAARGAGPRDARPRPRLRPRAGRRRARRRGRRGPPRRAGAAAAAACSTASARSTTTPTRRSAPRTAPSTARSPARPPPRASCCCATRACSRSIPARSARWPCSAPTRTGRG